MSLFVETCNKVVIAYLLSLEDERGFEGLVDEDEDVDIDDPELTDLKQYLIARLLEDQERFGPQDENEDEQTERKVAGLNSEPLMDTDKKYDFDDTALSEIESEYRRMENVNEDDKSEFERGYLPDDIAADDLNDFEQEEYLRNAYEAFEDNRFSDQNQEYMRDNGFDDNNQEDYLRDLNNEFNNDQSSDMNQDIEDSFFRTNNGERALIGNDFDEDDDEEYMRANDFNGDAWDVDQEFMRSNDFDEDEMSDFGQQEYERMANEEDELVNDNMQDNEDFDNWGEDERGIVGGDDDTDEADLNEEDREILSRLVEEILEKKVDGADDLDIEKELEKIGNL